MRLKLLSDTDARAAPETSDALPPASEEHEQREPGSVEQVVHGQAYTQVGNLNTQLHVTGPLVQIGASVERPEVSADLLREALDDAAVWHDLLEEQLIRRRSRAALRLILQVATEHPAPEALFQAWLRDTPEIQGQSWFVRPTLTHLTHALTNEVAQRRYTLLRDLMDGLFRSQAQGARETVALFDAFLQQLEAAPDWGEGHWNVLYAVARLFWLTEQGGEMRVYVSEAQRHEAQDGAVLALSQLSHRLLRAGRVTTINHFLTALAYLVQDVRTDEVIHLILRATDHMSLATRLGLQTGRELLNGLDRARSAGPWADAGDPGSRAMRHAFVDDVANQILKHLEQQLGRSEYFYELVRRAGMKEGADGRFVSRHRH